MADVPIGLFLSGGIDSSAVAVLLRDAPGGSAVSELQHGVRRRQLQRAAVRARDRRAVRDPASRAHGHARRPRVVRPPGGPSRRAVRRRLAVPDVPGVADGAGAREGGADRRRRRRAVRRLRRLRGAGAGGALGRPDAGGGVARRRRGARPRAADREEEGLVNKARRFVDGLAGAPARSRSTAG